MCQWCFFVLWLSRPPLEVLKGLEQSRVCYFLFLYVFMLIFLIPGMWKSLPPFLLPFRAYMVGMYFTTDLHSALESVLQISLPQLLSNIWDAIKCSNVTAFLLSLFWVTRQYWNQGKPSFSWLYLGSVLLCMCFAVFSKILWDGSLSTLAQLMLNLWPPSVFPQENQVISPIFEPAFTSLLEREVGFL